MKRLPNERVPVAMRIRGALYNEIIDAAFEHGRSVSSEIEIMVEKIVFFERMLEMSEEHQNGNHEPAEPTPVTEPEQPPAPAPQPEAPQPSAA